MINDIKQADYKDIWSDIMGDSVAETYHDHRRDNNYYTCTVHEIDKDVAPENP